MKNIKDYREKELKLYIIANVLLILATSNIISYNQSTESIEYFKTIIEILNISLISGFISIIAFLSDSIYSNGMKSKLVNIFGLIKQPGEKVFSDIFKGCKDIRIEKNDALNSYGNIKSRIDELEGKSKEKRKYENSQWYKIYHKYRNEEMIFVSNRDYLLCRDIFISTVSIMILYISFTLIFKIIKFSSIYFICLLVLLVISNISCHLKAKRMVFNVIAYDLSERDNNDVIKNV